MDDINEALSGILNDPESMKKVKSLAESLLGSNEKSDEIGISSDEIRIISTLMSNIKSQGNDKRTALLLALKPNLSAEKQEKVDVAIKLFKLISILPYLKESGLLNIL